MGEVYVCPCLRSEKTSRVNVRLEHQLPAALSSLSLHLGCARSCFAHVMVILGVVTTPCWLELTLLFLRFISWLSLFWL